jgi:hypothetical protein
MVMLDKQKLSSGTKLRLRISLKPPILAVLLDETEST